MAGVAGVRIRRLEWSSGKKHFPVLTVGHDETFASWEHFTLTRHFSSVFVCVHDLCV